MKNVLKGSVLQPGDIKLCVELLKLGGKYHRLYTQQFRHQRR